VKTADKAVSVGHNSSKLMLSDISELAECVARSGITQYSAFGHMNKTK